MQGVHCGQCRKKTKKEDQQAQVQKETQGQSSQEKIGFLYCGRCVENLESGETMVVIY
jgi:hypothetical protein